MDSFGTPDEIKEAKLIESEHFFEKFNLKDQQNKNNNERDEELGFLTFFFKKNFEKILIYKLYYFQIFCQIVLY